MSVSVRALWFTTLPEGLLQEADTSPSIRQLPVRFESRTFIPAVLGRVTGSNSYWAESRL
jgi:hypothetical protein